MAIEKMLFLNVVGMRTEAHTVLETLIQTEKVAMSTEKQQLYEDSYKLHTYALSEKAPQTIPHEQTPAHLANQTGHLQQLEGTLTRIAEGMGITLHTQKTLPPTYTLRYVEQQIEQLRATKGEQIHSYEVNEKTLAQLRHFRKQVGDVQVQAIDQTKLERLVYFDYDLGMVSKVYAQEIRKNIEHISAIFHKIGVVEATQEVIYLVLYPKQFAEETNKLLKSLDWVPLLIPDMLLPTQLSFAEALDQQMAQLTATNQAIHAALIQDKASDTILLERLYTRIKCEQRIATSQEAIVYGEDLFVWNGWVSAKDSQQVAEALRATSPHTMVFTKEAEAYEQHMMPPTQLTNKRLFQPFEAIVAMYGLPTYNEIDPTPFLGLTFMLMFGMMFGDIGQGFVYLLAGFVVATKSYHAGGILKRLGISSILFGFIYGSLFGLEQHQLPWLPSLTGPILVTETILSILVVAVVFGVVMLSCAFILGIINALRRGDIENGVFGKQGIVGYLFFLSFCVLVLSIVGVVPISFWIPLASMGIGLLIMICKEPLTNKWKGEKQLIHGSVGAYFTESIFEGFETLLSTLSHTISFIRIGAFALNHAGLFMAFLVMAEMTSQPILKGIILILGNVLILTLEGLVVFIQGLRLQYYELFSKYFRGDGKAYRPLKVQEE